MTVTRYNAVPYEKFGMCMGYLGIDVKFKKINYTKYGSTEIRLGKLLYYPLNPGCLSIVGDHKYWVDDEVNVGVRYIVAENQYSDTGKGCDYFPLNKLFYYIENK